MSGSEKPLLDRLEIIGLLGLFTALTATANDIVIPASTVIAHDLGGALNQSGYLLGAYMLAFSVGQVFWGLFSDAHGRRIALMITFAGFIAASLFCYVSQSFEMLLAGRFLQGLFGAGPILARAIVRDVSSGTSAARAMTLLGAILTIATIVAPLIGSAFVAFLHWRAIFLVLAGLGAAFLIATFVLLPETGRRRPERFRFGYFLRTGKQLLFMRDFIVPTLAGSLAFGGYVSLISNAPAATEQTFGVPPERYGWLMAILALSMMAGVLTARRLLRVRSLRFVGRSSVAVAGLSALASLVLLSVTPGLFAFWSVGCLFVFSFGGLLPTAQAAALEPAGDMPGFAASVMGAIQMVCGFLGSLLVARLFDGSTSAISLCIVIFTGLAILPVLLGLRIRPTA